MKISPATPPFPQKSALDQSCDLSEPVVVRSANAPWPFCLSYLLMLGLFDDLSTVTARQEIEICRREVTWYTEMYLKKKEVRHAGKEEAE